MQRHCTFPCHCLIKRIDNVSIKWSEEWTLINLWKSQMIIFVFSQILPWFPWIHDASHRPKYGLIITGWVLRHFTPLFIQGETIWLHSFSEAAAEEEVIKQSLFRRSATEQTSTDRIVQAAAALHLFCPQPFFKKKQLDLISLRCSLSCWAVNHTLMSPVEQTDLTDTCFTAAQVWIPLHPSLMLQRHLSPVWKTRTDSPCRPEAHKHLTWRLQRPPTKQQISRNDGEKIWRF